VKHGGVMGIHTHSHRGEVALLCEFCLDPIIVSRGLSRP